MKRIICTLLTTCFLINLLGCATGKETGALTGGAIGAGLGAAIFKDKLVGALVGGAVGALAGAVIGNYYDEQKKNRQESMRATNYRPTQGNMVRIEEATSNPVRVKPGEVVGLKTNYYVLSPSPETTVKIIESRIIKYQDEPVMEPLVREVHRNQGEHSSTAKITIPNDAPTGEYTVITIIDNGSKRDQSLSKFYVQRI